MRRIVSLIAFLALAACGGDSTGPNGGSVNGTYTLRTVNGLSVPAILAQDLSGKIEVTDDEYTLNADDTYSESGHFRFTASNGAVTTQPGSDHGTYTAINGAIQFSSLEGNGLSSGSVSGGTLTLLDQGLTAVYKR